MNKNTLSKAVRIALFASGSGTNAENIFNYFKGNSNIKAGLVVTNNPGAGVIRRAEKFGVPVEIITKEVYTNGDLLTRLMTKHDIHFIVLAGYLKLIPSSLVKNFEHRIINIHPALLPKFGGKGMFGMKVHEAVKDAGEAKTGITIHFVNEKFDEGEVIFQSEVAVEPEDTPVSIAEKIHKLEYAYFPKVIEDVVLSYQRS